MHAVPAQTSQDTSWDMSDNVSSMSSICLRRRNPVRLAQKKPSIHDVYCMSVTCFAAALMSDVYEDHKDEDGFLYITYSGENTFGC